MNIANKKRSLVILLGAAVYGAAVFAELASVQSAAAATVSQSDSTAVAAIQGSNSAKVADEELSRRVQAALHADPYFYDKHVSVSVDNGAVVLHGIVFSEWDLRDAMRIARQAADRRLVVDDLTIQLGGR